MTLGRAQQQLEVDAKEALRLAQVASFPVVLSSNILSLSSNNIIFDNEQYHHHNAPPQERARRFGEGSERMTGKLKTVLLLAL